MIFEIILIIFTAAFAILFAVCEYKNSCGDIIATVLISLVGGVAGIVLGLFSILVLTTVGVI